MFVRVYQGDGCGMQLSGNFVAATVALIYLKSTLKEAEVKVRISFSFYDQLDNQFDTFNDCKPPILHQVRERLMHKIDKIIVVS